MAERETKQLSDRVRHAPRTRSARGTAQKSKQQRVFACLSDTVKGGTDLKAFLSLRMKSSISFEILKTPEIFSSPEDGVETGVVLLFQSKSQATKAIHLFHESNRFSPTRISCYLTNEEGKRDELQAQVNTDNKLVKHMSEIIETAASTLKLHEKKIEQFRQEVEEIEQLLSNKRGLSLDEFEKSSCEKGAREDKLKELELQRQEYKMFLASLKTNFSEIKNVKNSDAKIKELRTHFGVECNRLKCALPMYARRSDILDVVKANQVSVILGETGSGKSTQMVQYLYQAGLAGKGIIACTQPRKIAATSLATRVSAEMASSTGQVVGYQVGMQTRKSGITKILYMTDHILLNECLKDKNLSEFSCIIIDEAHERSIYTDLLLGMIKSCLRTRPDLRVIITSATINPDIFVSFFGGQDVCPVLQVSGRAFPVSVYYMDQNDEQPFPENYEEKAVNKAIEVHTTSPVTDGDILVFLASPLETEKCMEKFQRTVGMKNIKCMQLHGKLQAEEQREVFEPAPAGVRKIVFATNSAETSITITGIKFVIDTGVAKEMRYDDKRNMNSLSIFPVSKSSANQRKGRAGRTGLGTCFRLYSEKDFFEMESNTKPEILRVHLGQALLKLLDLGVNPLEFDFVESPPRSSLCIAMESLQDINAVENGCITDIGQWIAKLPLDPQLGAMVKTGLNEGVVIETLVIAACCSSSNIFYRSGTDKEKKVADVKKTQFCHRGGDLLTMLNVFRDWHPVHENEKGKWCKNNCINGKAMKGVRQTVNEVLTVLRKEMKVDVKFDLKPKEEVDLMLQGVVIQSMKRNVCCYLGHEQAGYITGKQLQEVQIHPSSSLKSLAQSPKQVVYWQLLQTSRAFITNVTPVGEECIQKMRNKICFDINEEDIQRQCVSQMMKIAIGNFAFRRFIGRMHTNRRQIEEQLKEICNNNVVIIEANRELGEIQLFCNGLYSDTAIAHVDGIVKELTAPLKLETLEVALGKSGGGVRIVLGEGGSVQDILMPQDFRTVKVKFDENGDNRFTTDVLRTELAYYGKVEKLIPYKKTDVFWGQVTFCKKENAMKAVAELNEKKDNCIKLIPENVAGRNSAQFTLKMSWNRRLSKGFGYVELQRPEDTVAVLTAGSMYVDNHIVSITKAKKGNIYLKGFGAIVSEETVVEELARKVGVSADNTRFKVIVPRTDSSMMSGDYQRDINAWIKQLTTGHQFKVTVKEIKPKTVKGLAFVTFTCPDTFHTVANGIQQHPLYLDGQVVVVDIRSSISIEKRVYEATKEEVDTFLTEMKAHMPQTVLTTKTTKAGTYIIEISSPSTGDLASAKVGIDKIIDGDRLSCEHNKKLLQLFTRDAREFLKNVQKEEHSFVYVDNRTMSISIQGTSRARTLTLVKINEYLDTFGESFERQVYLRGPSNPIGLMKALLVRYGTDLELLQTESGLQKITLNHRAHSLCLIGSEEAIGDAMSKIETVTIELQENSGLPHQKQENLPECPICMCGIEPADRVQLEYCGHPYCKPCLESQFKISVKDKQFPIVCSVDGCEQGFVLKDLEAYQKREMSKIDVFVKAALHSCVTKNQMKYKYCITPDCDMVYCVSDDGTSFVCSECHTNMCTSCHVQYHDGLTCQMYKYAREGGDESVDLWIKQNPMDRKKCPKCKIGIEKINGCNHMTCSACKAHICWVCLEYFDTCQNCYGHLQNMHSSFV